MAMPTPSDAGCEICQGALACIFSGAAQFYAMTYPIVAGAGMTMGFLLALHGVIRLIWRWSHGMPTFYDIREKTDAEQD